MMKNYYTAVQLADANDDFLIDLLGELGWNGDGDSDDFKDRCLQIMYECYDSPEETLDLVRQAFTAGWKSRGEVS